MNVNITIETHKRLKAYCKTNDLFLSWQTDLCINEWLDQQGEADKQENEDQNDR